MTRTVKWVGISIGGLVLLAVLAVVLLPPLVNLERYRTLLAQRVGRTLGREVSLGALRVSLWGGIGAEATSIHVGQASGFGTEPFLSVEAVRVRFQLLPLLRGQVKVTSLVLERPRVRLVHGSDGRWNAEDLLRGRTSQGSAKPPAETARPGKAPLFGGLLLSEVTVRNGEIILVEQSQPGVVGLSLADVDLTLRQKNASDPIDLQSRARLVGAASGQIEAAGRITPGEKEALSADGTLSFTDVEAKAWQALLPSGADGPMVAGPVSGELRLAGPLARTAFLGNLNLKPTTVRFGRVFRKPAGEDARLAFQGQREGEGLRLTNFTITFRDTTLAGTAHLPDVKVPRIAFTATSARLNLDRLLAAPAKRAWLWPSLAWAAAASRGASTPPVSSLIAQGKVSLGELTYQGVTWSAVEADLQYQGGILRLPDVRADFAQGRLRANGEADLRQSTPRVSLTSRLEKAATEPLLKALAVGPWTLKSGLDVDGQFQFAGVALPDILGSAVGGGSLQLRSGRVIDYRPLDRLAEMVTPILAAQGVRVRLNEFDQVNGHYTVDKGVARTTDLTLTKPEGTITAVGTLGLLDSALNFDVVAKFGRSTIEAKVTGTTAQPVVVPKLNRMQQKIEREIDKALPGEKGKDLKEIFRGLFGR
jgi:AsmA protein